MKHLISKRGFKARFEEINAVHEALKQKYAGNPEKLAEVNEEMMLKIRKTWGEWERFKSMDMIQEAKKFNIDFPSIEEKEAWLGLDMSYGLPLLSNKGKLMVRQAVDEEKIRRKEVASWWWKTVVIPALAAATGLVGALTGLFGVLHHK